MISIFEFSDYKAYLKALELQRSQFQKGFRSRLAETLDCQNAYISQILNTGAHFSLEQGLKVSTFLRLTEIEIRYFILLIERSRAGTKELRAFFEKDLEALRERRLDIQGKVPKTRTLTFEDQSLYYSSWVYPTIHMLVTIPHFGSITKIVSVLGISEDFAREVILFLVTTGLINEKDGELVSGTTQVHLSIDSPFIRQHHNNWRAAAIQSLNSFDTKGLHYSTVSSLSNDDVEKIKSKFIKVIQEYVEVIAPSKEETLYNFNLDFYSLLRK